MGTEIDAATVSAPAESDSAPPTPTINLPPLGNYELLEVLGRGGMGAVYKARHLLMNRLVAIKVIDPNRVSDPQLAERFRREVDVCSQLQHEHIVQAYDVGIEDEMTYLVLEFVEGSNLSALVKRDGAMPSDEAAAIALQAASGLAYAHRKGIVHRDIKPLNILLSSKGATKVLDLGLARVQRELSDGTDETGLTRDGSVMGTVDYMSPEQARDAHAVDARSDLYSLGATLYYLLTARPPFPGGSAIEKLHRLAVEDPQPVGQIRPDCPRGLTDVVERLMEKDPNKRFESAEDAVRALRPFATDRLAGRPVVTTAVQTAAETIGRPELAATVEESPAPFIADDEATSLLTRLRTDPQRSKRTVGLGVAGALAVVCIAVVAILTGFGKRNGGNATPKSNNGETTVTKPGTPPAGIRIELPGHFDGVICFAWSPDEKRIATGGGDGDVRIWDVAAEKERGRCVGHRGTVLFVAFSPDGKQIASADSRDEIRVWNWRQGKTIATAKRPQAPGLPHKLVFSPDSSEVAFLARFQVIRLNIATGKMGAGLPVKEVPIDMAYSRNGKRLAVATAKGGVDVWDILSSQRMPLLRPDEKLKVIATAHDGLLAVAEHGRVRFLDMKSGREVRDIKIPPAADRIFTTQHTNRPHAQFVDGGRSVVLNTSKHGRRGVIVDLSTGKQRKIPAPFFASSPSGDFTGRMGNAYLSVYRATSPERQRTLANAGVRRSTARILGDRYLQISGFGELTVDLVAGKELKLPPYAFIDKAGKVWSVRNGIVERARADWLSLRPQKVCELQSSEGYLPEFRMNWTGYHWSPDGRRVFAAAQDEKSVRVWNAADGTILQTLQIPSDRLRQDFGRYGPAVNRDATMFAFTRPPSTIVIQRTDKTRTAAVEIESDLSPVYSGLALSPDGRFLFQSARPKGEFFAQAWDLRTKRRIWKTGLRGQTYGDSPQLVVSPSGRYVMAMNSILEARTGKRIWGAPRRDHASATSLQNRSHTPHRYGDFFPDDRHAVIVHDNQFQIWDFQRNKKRATLYLLPGRQWALVNHETGHIAGSPSALQYLRFGHKIGDATFWLTPAQYAKDIGWKPDPKQAGLKFLSKPARPTAARRVIP